MENMWIYVSLFLYLFWKHGILAVSERYFMEDECGRMIDMQTARLESVRLDLTKFEEYHDSFDCTLRIAAPPDKRLQIIVDKNHIEYHDSFDCMLRIAAPPDKRLQIIVDKNHIEWSPNCTHDFLQLLDGPELNGKSVQGANDRICSSSDVMSSYATSGRHLTLRFKSNSEHTGDGFKLLITAFRDDKDCYNTEFRCKRDLRCISEQLVCNRFRDCSDASDECDISTAAVIGIAVASVVVVFSAIGIVVCWCCVRKRRRHARESSSAGSSRKRAGSDVLDNSGKMFQNEKADIHYYRPKTVAVENVYSTLPYTSSGSPQGSFVVTGPHNPAYLEESQNSRHKWITVPPTALQDVEGNYFSPYGH